MRRRAGCGDASSRVVKSAVPRAAMTARPGSGTSGWPEWGGVRLEEHFCGCVPRCWRYPPMWSRIGGCNGRRRGRKRAGRPRPRTWLPPRPLRSPVPAPHR
jgi:hypothetical protein